MIKAIARIHVQTQCWFEWNALLKYFQGVTQLHTDMVASWSIFPVETNNQVHFFVCAGQAVYCIISFIIQLTVNDFVYLKIKGIAYIFIVVIL